MWITTHPCNQYAVDCINGQHLSPTAIHGLPVKVGNCRKIGLVGKSPSQSRQLQAVEQYKSYA